MICLHLAITNELDRPICASKYTLNKQIYVAYTTRNTSYLVLHVACIIWVMYGYLGGSFFIMYAYVYFRIRQRYESEAWNKLMRVYLWYTSD